METPQNTFEELCHIFVTTLKKENINEFLDRDVAGKVWNELGSKDIRDVIKVARLSTSIDDVRLLSKCQIINIVAVSQLRM